MTRRRKHVLADESIRGLAKSGQFCGLADFEAPAWFAVFLPRGASEPIFRKLNQAAFATADTPSVQERLHVLASRWWKDELTDTIRLNLRATAKLVVFATNLGFIREFGITVHDHLIVGKDGHASLKALKLM